MHIFINISAIYRNIMVKHLLLTLSDELWAALESRRAKFGYLTRQEIVTDIIRKALFAPEKKKSRAERTLKVDDQFMEYFSRK